ncbi:MAG: hypothetical protein U5K69_04830 [Balneolaceae bacterium]|nr:hypothetical protein [Balneolaceae bacterium]
MYEDVRRYIWRNQRQGTASTKERKRSNEAVEEKDVPSEGYR